MSRHWTVCVAVLVVVSALDWQFLPRVDAADCSICGPECTSACGTRLFRACCFNYNRKRSYEPPGKTMDGDDADDDNANDINDLDDVLLAQNLEPMVRHWVHKEQEVESTQRRHKNKRRHWRRD